ncbi:uncharacterized protein LOC119998529 [Tripterygium wilfordii]|uniref:uncharacterized protein LOC119998529 n=1 Tax=Tripterygium wilfordii TaxID=458696 RepID=UPI0018F80295|nr:uncharacterized protein LOC119998529 [Tripterygium wilfordii]
MTRFTNKTVKMTRILKNKENDLIYNCKDQNNLDSSFSLRFCFPKASFSFSPSNTVSFSFKHSFFHLQTQFLSHCQLLQFASTTTTVCIPSTVLNTPRFIMAYIIPEGQHFPAKVSNFYQPDVVICNIKDQLNDDQLETFSRSCFGMHITPYIVLSKP